MSDDKDAKADKRLDYFKDRISAGFPKLAGAKLDKMLATDEVREAILQFCEDEQKRCLVVPESMKLDFMIPSKGKGKALMFVKLQSAVLKMDGISSQLTVLEIGANPFEHLELLANEIFLPVLSNPQNQAKWGEVPTREIMDRFHNFLSSTTILCGQIKGETRLPMPPIDLSGGPNTGKNRISLLEGAIITWTKQIRSVLKQDPESQLKQGMHPTPDVEIEFWKNKASNLNSIFEQLQGPRIRRVLRALDQSKSTYCTTFARLCKEVFTARMEANDNTKYLRTLEYWFQALNSEDDFPKTVELFKPMLHIILLIWKNSKHYNVPARLVVLMREICNSLIKQATKYVSGEQIFSMIESEEANQAVTMLKTTLHVCGAFKSTYFDYKNTANAECPANPWKIQNNALFMRLDSFLERCHDILDLTQTIVQFSKLAKIEVGGTKGKSLTASIKQIYDDFHQAVAKFKAVPYDIMDVGAKAFDDDFYEFRCSIKELERRLGAVVSLAFDDCSNVYGRFKLLDSFEGLLERPIIQDELEKKYIGLVQSYGQDLKTVQELFLHYRDNCPIAWNLPPIAGALTWCRGLVERIEIPFVKLNQLEKSILEREEAKEVSKVYHTIKASLQEFESQKIEEWGRDVEQSSHSKLKLPLLTRNPETRLLNVNFDPALVRLLREVKYFLLLGLNVPETALEIYQQVETFRAWTGNLDLIVNMNNDVLNILLPVERPLAMPYLTKFDAVIEKGLATMNWKSAGITEFIADSMEQVKAVSEVVRTMKNNLRSVSDQLQSYNKPLLIRKTKPIAKDEFEKEHKNFVKERYTEIKECGKNIHNMVKDTNKVLRVSNASNDWKAYVDFVNNVVVDGLAKVVYTSLDYLFEQIDPVTIAKEDKLPLIEVKLDLISVRHSDDIRRDEVRFIPDLKENSGKGVRDLINSWIGSFFNVSTLFKRLDNDGTYLREIHADHNVKVLLAIISETLETNEAQCMEVLQQYEKFNYLWLTDMTEHFQAFLDDAMEMSPNQQLLPNLDKFLGAIVKYEQIRETVQHFQSPMDVGWLRINTQPVKSQLITWTSRWIDLFMNHLKVTIRDKLNALDKFMAMVNVGLDVEVTENHTMEGKQALMRVMEDIRDVRKAIDATKELFQPLQESINILKSHGTDLATLEKINGKYVQDYLDDAPLAWDSVVKKTFRKKEDILPLQLSEVENLKVDLEHFFIKVREFRNNFRAQAPFTFTGTPLEAYKQMDFHAQELEAKEKEAKRFNELEELFELQVSKYNEMGDTRLELRLLKQVWDMKAQIFFTYDSWNTQLWNDIKTDDLEDINKNLLKNLRKMGSDNPVVKGWVVYRSIEEMIKNMSVVLPLINELHSNAMRDRHWKNLAKVCGVKSIDPNDPKFTFEDMIALKLHEHTEDVEEIVETAAKELKIERKLRDIETIWRDMCLEYVPHNDTEMYLVKLSEEVIESLESHQLELQTMIGMGKFVDFFRDRVLQWQGTLGSMEDVLKVWVNVTRSWAALESIFLASADIRSQLPDDTKRFEGIDSEFKELMKDAVNVPNCIQVCLVDGRQEALSSMMTRLDQCQKSLNEYLDQKKKIFPRFYFVSNVALLDMLANGTNPPKIMKYLGDCYDSLDELIFVTDADGNKNVKLANEMVAKDKERLMLSEPFPLEGEVERYLNNLTEAMRYTLKLKMQDGYHTAGNWEVDKPRHEWLFYYPAQTVVTTTQIYWTEETETALEDLSGGQEDAVKRYLQVCDIRLQELIKLVLGKLSKGDRVKIITIITLDVHARDVIQKLIDEKVEGLEAFLWQQQLRFYWLPGNLDTEIRICDFRTKYFYEWIGNTGRLVITPLTDRCYVTLTMGLRLFLGGAPAGPAGTGKTETTKDLARALALPCYVFNCSDQMNYQTMADIFRGLAQTGTWGCFDEFNRISIEVLSVVATQVKTVQDCIKKLAIVANREPEYQHLPPGLPPCKIGNFMFEGDLISIVPTCGFFITMNPGYAGRTELPDNLKALFRPVTMIVPDFLQICEIMLFSEGFEGAKVLAKKMTVLYKLSKEQLSKQYHYDFGLRALKSVLVMAGGLKRQYQEMPEDLVLMRCLRDSNMPKFVFEDVPLFGGLINDLFPGMDCPRVGYEDLKQAAMHDLESRGFRCTNEVVFSDQIDKVIQMYETQLVRHTTMIVGPTGGGKSLVLDTLKNSRLVSENVVVKMFVLNPKAQPLNELYGEMDPATRDWTDGILSKLFRELNDRLPPGKENEMRWIVYDGDVDALWVENMNSVMDDNRLLTLPNGERIRLQAHCAMICETFDLQYASPATISRCGMVWVDPKNLGYFPYYERWIRTRFGNSVTIAEEKQSAADFLLSLYEKYITKCIDMILSGMIDGEMGQRLKQVIPIANIDMVKQLCSLLDAFLPVDTTDQMDIEHMYIYCIVWSLGAALVGESRVKFDTFLKKIAREALPDNLLYDVYYDLNAHKWEKWQSQVPKYVEPAPFKFYEVMVPTTDSILYSHMLNHLAPLRPILFVGESGTAKSTIIQRYLTTLPSTGFAKLNINFSSRTTAADVQTNIEANVDKRSANVYGPSPAGKKLIVFIDDLNMPKVDTYGTQQPIALLFFLIGRGCIYDREKDLNLKMLKDLQYIGAMGPPGGGRNPVDPRFVALFNVFNLTSPTNVVLNNIYSSIINSKYVNFQESVKGAAAKITASTLKLFGYILEKMPPTPSKFHYIFNLRDLSRIYEGLCNGTPDVITTSPQFVRLWKNECDRVFFDRLTTVEDQQIYNKEITNIIKESFADAVPYATQDPLLFGDFEQAVKRIASEGEAEDARLYKDMGGYDAVRKIFSEVLELYNQDNKPMTLVLFEQALEHLCRIHRIIRNPRGNALLVGVGGSGKQSLTKLATFCAGYKLFQITLSRGYNEEQFKTDLKDLYKLLGQNEVVFLFTDAHVVEEGFLEFINNMLTTGMVPALYEQDEKDALCATVRQDVRNSGLPETSDNLWSFYVNKCRNNLHIVLAMSPSGSKLRLRCRNFPGLVSNAVIDWFFPWPKDALQKVAEYFLAEEALPDEHRAGVIDHLVFTHQNVTSASTRFAEELRRYYYVTPKNYLDFINNYRQQLAINSKRISVSTKRLEGGLQKLIEAASAVDRMKIVLTEKKIVVDAKTEKVQALIAVIQDKTAVANVSQEQATVKQKYAGEQAVIIKQQKEEADEALLEALPAVEAASRALENLDKNDLTELKAFTNPPPAVKNLCMQLVCLRPTGEKLEESWNDAKKMLSNPQLLQLLKNYPKDDLTDKQVKKVNKYFNEELTLEKMSAVSKAGFGLLTWVVAIVKYYEVAKNVTPLREKVKTMEKAQMQTEKELAELQQTLATLSKEINELNSQFQEANGELDVLQQEAALMTKRLNAASQLIEGLTGERTRWSADVHNLEQQSIKLVGDCLLGSSFLSYMGAFTTDYRRNLIYDKFLADVHSRNIPLSEGFTLEKLLTTDAIVQGWISKGLPADDHSIQNGILTTKGSRFPLCIDPQQQAVTWIKRTYSGKTLTVKTLTDSDFMKHLELAIQFGNAFLFENIDEELDPMLDPVLEKNIIKENGNNVIKLGDKVIEWDENFRLFFTTKLANPHYSPEVMGKTMIINYGVTMDGLANQLLNVVVGNERPDLEKQWADLVVEMGENTQLLVSLEDTLLRELSSSQGNILDNQELIATLENTKSKAVEIQGKLQLAEQTKLDISTARSVYKPVAKRGSILYFAEAGLATISSMYEISLDSFLSVFKTSLEVAKKDSNLDNRLRNMIETITRQIYDYTCTGIFERHKLMFSFQMTCMIMSGDGKLETTMLDFFLKGDTSLEGVSEPSPAVWLSGAGWKDLVCLGNLEEHLGELVRDFKATHHGVWKEWYDLEAPETVPIPGGFHAKLTPLQRLAVMRCFRPDRVYNAVKLFVIEIMGEKYVQPPVLDYARIFSQSSPTAPMVFILSPGADPQSDIQKFCDEMNMSNRFKFVALGQGQGPIAEQLLEVGYKRGHWVLLQNCHLLASWLKVLEKLLNEMKDPHKEFRLWLTTEPTDKFPLGILQRSLKVVTEPPDGLKLNMRATYSRIDASVLDECPHWSFRPCLYVLSFLHAVVLERRKYGKIGWNVNYDFNESDFNISRKLLSLYLTKSFEDQDEFLPWGSLKYLIGDAMYGGRVSDDMDRRILKTYLEEYMGDFLFDDCQKFHFSNVGFDYALPPHGELENYTLMIESLPLTNSPAVFGLHPNAEIGYYSNAVKSMWLDLISLQPRRVASGEGMSREEYIGSTARDIYSKIPIESMDIGSFDLLQTRTLLIRRNQQLYDLTEEMVTPCQVVLLQELERWNNLVKRMALSLLDLQRALSGEIGMSDELDALGDSLFNGFLPAMWRRLCPDTQKPLGSWMGHFTHRHEQYSHWISTGEPAVMWLSGLHIPESYLTALVQTTCRARGWPLDKSTLYTVVTKFTSTEGLQNLESGCYVHGLYLEGAAWDHQTSNLRAQDPKVLVVELPIMQVIPIEASKLKLHNTFRTPVYVTQARRNAMGVGLVFEADLATLEHSSHWVLQGVSLCLNIDT